MNPAAALNRCFPWQGEIHQFRELTGLPGLAAAVFALTNLPTFKHAL
jgi:hypothetical protein